MRSSNTNLMHYSAEAGRRYFFFQYLLLFAILLFAVYQYGLHRIYGFSVYPDEFGYWASAAQWVGYDWSGTASLGYYYSFGYSLILAPILYFCHGGVPAYRVAVTVNMFLQCASIGLMWGIIKRLYGLSGTDEENAFATNVNADTDINIQKMRAVFAVGVAIFYPAWTFYMQMTLAEALLTFLYAFICYQFVLVFEKPKMISIMLLSLSFLYLYFIHMRTVGVVLAGILILLLFMWHRPENRKRLLVTAALLLAGAGAGFLLKNVVQETVYATADAANLAANDYVGQFMKLKGILTAERLLQLFQSCVGKLYYLGMASFGLLYPALALCIKRTIRFFKIFFKKSDQGRAGGFSGADGIYFFLLLSFLGQFMVSAIGAGVGGRQDGLVYGRYNEYLLPVFLAIGVMELFESRHLIRNLICSMGISTILFIITFLTALKNDSTLMYGFFATGLSYLSEDIYSYQVKSEYPKAWLFGIFLNVFITACIGIGRRMKQNIFGVGIIILMEIMLTMCLSKKYTWYANDIDYYDLKICEYIEEYENAPINSDMPESGEAVPVGYLHGGGTPYVALLQFAMPDKTIQIYKEPDETAKNSGQVMDDVLPQKGFLIINQGSVYLEQAGEKYEKCMEGASFVLFLAK